MKVKDYYTDSISAGIITMLDKPEIVNRLLSVFIINFDDFDICKFNIDVHHIREELEEYTDIDTTNLYFIKKVQVFYDGNLLMLAKILRDINYNTDVNFKVYSPVIGCPIGCKYCFSKDMVDHFKLSDSFNKPIFRGPYKVVTDKNGNSMSEIFNVRSDKPIDWMLTYYSDFGCWNKDWKKNVFEQIIVANEYKRIIGKPLDTFTLITKYPRGINLDFISKDIDLSNVIISCTIDRNSKTDRILNLMEQTKDLKITTCVTYQPVLEHIEPVYLDKLVNTFGKENTWVIIGGWVGDSPDKIELQFEFIKDIIDKCIELGIPIKMESDIKQVVIDNGYEYLEQSPYCMLRL